MPGKLTGLVRNSRPLVVAALVVTAALVWAVPAPSLAQDAGAGRPYDRDFGETVLVAGFEFVEQKYVHPVSMHDFSLAAIRGLGAIDRNLNIDERDGSVTVTYLGETVGSYRMPGDNDGGAWARFVADIVDALRAEARRFRNADSEAIFEALYDGATTVLDRASRYNSAAEAADARANRQGFGGVGLILDTGFRNAEVLTVLAGSPAEEAGLQVGDRVTHIDGQPVAGWANDRLRSALRGTIESTVELTVQQRGGATISADMERARIVPPTVTLAGLANGLADIRVELFNRNTATGVQAIVGSLLTDADQPLRGVTLDLRFNPGGLLNQATAVADLFLVGGPIARSVGRAPDAGSEFFADETDILDGLPIIVLINSRSASAAEVLAAALQDRGRAVVVGSNSFGKGSVQSVYPLPNAGDIVMTWSLLRAPSGYAYDGLGVLPNVCTSGRGGVELAGGLTLVPPDPSVILARFRAAEAAPFRSLFESWRAIQGAEETANIEQLRRNCAPARGDHFLDLHIAHALLDDSALYAQAIDLSGTGPITADDELVASEAGENDETAEPPANLLSNDFDLDGDRLVITQVNGSPSAVGQEVRLASGASVTITADGTVEIDPGSMTEELAQGEISTELVTYTVSDGEGGEATATVSITIEGRNDIPIAGDDIGVIDEDGVLEFGPADGLLANDSDAETEVLEIVAVNGQDGLVDHAFNLASGAVLLVRGDGSYLYDPDGGFDWLTGEASEFDEFTYEVADGDGGRAVATVSLEIAGTNDRPVAVADEIVLDEDTRRELVAALGVLANDVDPDDGDLEVAAVNGDAVLVGRQISVGRGLAVTVNRDGSVIVDPSGMFETVAAAQTVEQSIEYAVRDASGALATGTINFVVVGLNDAPVAVDDRVETDRRSSRHLPLAELLANDSDIDDPEFSVLAIEGAPRQPGDTIITERGGRVEVGADGSLTYDPSASEALAALGPEEVLDDRFSYTIVDPNGAVDTGSVIITVAGRGPAVTIGDDRFEVRHDATLRVDAAGGLLANDRSEGGGSIEIATLNGAADNIGRAVASATGALLTVARDGSLTFDPNGAHEGLSDGERAIESFSYTVLDRFGEEAGGELVVAVVGGAPRGGAGGIVVRQDEVAVIDVLSQVTDPDGDEVTLTNLATETDGVRLTTDELGRVIYDPNGRFDELGEGERIVDRFIYEVSDGRGGTASATVVLTVIGRNDPPVARRDTGEVAVGGQLQFDAAHGLLANDADVDGDPLSVVGVGDGSGGDADADVGVSQVLASGALVNIGADGSLTYVPPTIERLRADGAGERIVDRFSYAVDDGQGGTARGVVEITILNLNRAPVARDIGEETEAGPNG